MPTTNSKNTATDQSLEPTPLEQWGKKRNDEGVVVELPSGNICKIRRTLDMMPMLQAGKIPNPLAKILNEMIDSGESNFAKAAQEHDDPEALRQLFDLLNQQMAKAFVEPPVSAPPPREPGEGWEDYMQRCEETDWLKPGTLSVHDIEIPDKMYVYGVAQGAASDLARFREESESAMGTVPASKGVVKPTKRTGGGKSGK